jgi:hypothetical protein
MKNKTIHLNTLLYSTTTKFVKHLPIIERKNKKENPHKMVTKW